MDEAAPNPTSPGVETTTPPVNPRDSVGIGLGLLVLLHLIQIPLTIFLAGVFWIGISQLLYLIPAVIILSKRGWRHAVKGLWIGAGITFLINAACFGLVMWSLSNTSFR